MQNRALEQYLERHLHRYRASPGEACPDDLDCPRRVCWDRRCRTHPAAVVVVSPRGYPCVQGPVEHDPLALLKWPALRVTRTNANPTMEVQ